MFKKGQLATTNSGYSMGGGGTESLIHNGIES